MSRKKDSRIFGHFLNGRSNTTKGRRNYSNNDLVLTDSSALEYAKLCFVRGTSVQYQHIVVLTRQFVGFHYKRRVSFFLTNTCI